MARSFWSKRKDNLQAVDGYVKATDSVSRPTALLLTILGILVVGGLLFGVFSGTRWVISKISEDDTTNIASTGQSTPAPVASPNTQPAQSNPSSGSSITATTSTSTTTPSTPVVTAPTTVVAATSTNIPNTGPTQNYLVVFMATTLLGYVIYRKTLKD